MNVQGMGHVVGFCGDGFNDIPAIQATDLGIAVGASEAALTAPIFTSNASAKGEHAIPRCHFVSKRYRVDPCRILFISLGTCVAEQHSMLDQIFTSAS